MTQGNDVLQPLDLNQAEHCLDPLFAMEGEAPCDPADPSLPYHTLGPYGLERLCFQLLVQRGMAPRLFGKPGQAQYGIDLLAETSGGRGVYQCKNLDHEPSVAEIREAVEKFTSDWLGKAGLPAPAEFFYCCPQHFDDSRKNKDFIGLQEKFKTATGIELHVWHRATFDARLQGLPDLVSGLFSPQHARLFCKAEDWNDDFLVQVTHRRPARHRLVERFLTLRDGRKIFVAPELDDQFRIGLTSSPVLLVRGLPGSGKTTTTLEMATRLLYRQPGLRYRICFAQLVDGVKVSELVNAIKRRLSLPTLIILDDCHVDFSVAEKVVERLGPELKDPKQRLAILLIARHTPTPEETEADEDPDLVVSLKGQDAVITVATGRKPMEQVLCYLRPDLGRLSDTRFERIFRMTGGDLFLLDQVLAMIQSPTDVDGLDLHAIFLDARKRYFSRAAIYLPSVMQITALAQFGLAPQIRFCPKGHDEREHKIIESLVTPAGRSTRYYFLHSSLAELLLHALVDASGDSDESCIEECILDGLMQYFQALSKAPVYPRMSAKLFLDDLQVLVRARLKLISEETEVRLKASFLARSEVVSLIASSLDKLTHSFLSLCLFLTRRGQPMAMQPFMDLLTKKILSLFPESGVLS